MANYVYVVTSVEMGWDCICGVYKDYQKAVLSCFWDDDRSFEEKAAAIEDGDTSYIIHTKRLEQ